MKRVVVTFCAVALAALAASALAGGPPADKPGALKIELVPTANAPQGASGFIVINEPAKKGRYILNIHVKGLESNQWVAWGIGLGDRDKGGGEFQCNIAGIGHDTNKWDDLGVRVVVKAIGGPGGDGPVVFNTLIP